MTMFRMPLLFNFLIIASRLALNSGSGTCKYPLQQQVTRGKKSSTTRSACNQLIQSNTLHKFHAVSIAESMLQHRYHAFR
jgi:hypothetical protein